MKFRSILAAGPLVLALAVVPSAAWAQNLLSGTLFQTNSPLARLPAGWMCQSSAAVRCEVDPAVRHGDAPAARVTAEPSEQRLWHLITHPVRDLRPNTPYTISVWAKTEGLPAGSLAYISLNCFASGKRLAANDSDSKLTGTNPSTTLFRSTSVMLLPCRDLTWRH